MNPGKLPEGWRWARLCEVVHEDRRPATDGTAPYLGLDAIESMTGRMDGSNNVQGDGLTFKFDHRHILYGKLRPYLNKVALPTYNGRCSTEIIPLLPNDEVERRYVAAFLRAPATVRAITGEATGSRMPRADMHVVANLHLPLPSFPEQQRIADAIDAAIAEIESAACAAETQCAWLNRTRSSAFIDLLRQEDVSQTVPLIDLCIRKGQYGLSVKASANPPGVPMLRMGNIQKGRLDWSDVVYASVDDKTASAYRVKPGDVLFNRTNSAELVGKTAVVEEESEAVFASYLVRFSPDQSKADPRYIAEIINSPIGRSYIERQMDRAIGQVNINASKMHGFPVPCPPVSRQRVLMDTLTTIHKAAQAAQDMVTTQRKALHALPSAILSAAFQGQL